MEDIFSALLEMSRLDAGAMKVELSNFRIDDLFRQLRIEFAPLAEKKGLQADLRALLARRALGSPAAAPPAAEPDLERYQIHPRAAGFWSARGVLRGKLRLEVWDTGMGIPVEKQKRVFREFERLETAGAEPGLGLGLSIVERMARVLGHQITLRSAPDKGSVFAVTAPDRGAAAAVASAATRARDRHAPVAARST